MKFHSPTLALLIVAVFFLAECKPRIPGNEIPVTTRSKEALRYFIDGRDKFENNEFIAAVDYLEKAIRTDTSFAMAYLYLLLSGDESVIFQKNPDKIVSLIDRVSDGEKKVIQYYFTRTDGDVQRQKEYLDQLLLLYPADKRVQMMAGE